LGRLQTILDLFQKAEFSTPIFNNTTNQTVDSHATNDVIKKKEHKKQDGKSIVKKKAK